MSFPSSSPATNPFLVDSLIGACRTDSFYSSSNMYMPSGSEMGTYGTCGLLPSFGKTRGEVSHQNPGVNLHPYIPQLENWSDPGRVCRTDSTMSNCTFSQSIKEESNCCMFSEKRLQRVSSPEVPAYPIAEPCSVDGPEIPVPGYFRLSQTYAHGKHAESYSHDEPPSPNPTLLQLSRVKPPPPTPPPPLPPASSFTSEPEENVQETEPARTPSPDQALQSSEEKRTRSCSMEARASSPELQLQKEGKGGLAAGRSFYLNNKGFGIIKSKNKTQTTLKS